MDGDTRLGRGGERADPQLPTANCQLPTGLVVRKYGGTSVVLRLFRTWLLLVTGGGPTPDKPDVTFAPPADPRTVAHAMTVRVPDCRAAYETLRGRGAEFLTPPVDYEWEVRCFFRDPDGHLLELSEARAPATGT